MSRDCHPFRFAALALCAAVNAQAATFTVTNTNNSGAGSLRQAITDANATVGSDVIAFAIPGAGAHTITLTSELPAAAGALVIDGYSQPGSSKNTRTPQQDGLDTRIGIEISGPGNGSIRIQPGATLTLQGLALNHFGAPFHGDDNASSTTHLNLYGCFVGTHADGSAFAGFGNYDGIDLEYTAGQIGGTLPWQRNLISGNADGVLARGPVTIEGNLIGTDIGGTQAIPNSNGIYLVARAHVRIGGSDPAARNVISGNRAVGIEIYPGSQAIGDFEIKGNYIGTDASGTRRLSNGYTDPAMVQYGGGIHIRSNSGQGVVPIGGFNTGEANLIAFNRGFGIGAAGSLTDNTFFDNRGNRLHHNAGLGDTNIDLGPFGRTANDPADADSGANNLQNWPEIPSASQNGNQLTVTYRVDTATANAAYPLYVDFYADVNGGSGALLGEDVYDAAHAQQPRSVVLTLPPGVRAIPFVATATDSNGYSSELSSAFDVIFEDDFD